MCSRTGWCDEGAAGGKEEAGPGREGLNKAFGFHWKAIRGLETRGSSDLIFVLEELSVCCVQDELKEARGRQESSGEATAASGRRVVCDGTPAGSCAQKHA